MRAVFLDRDSTINVGVPTYERVDKLDKVKLLPHSLKALSELANLDFLVFVVTNQLGIGEGLITQEDFNNINDQVLKLIAPSGIKIIHTYVCPHLVEDNCDCRKPSPKFIKQAARDYQINLAESYTIGDRISDIEAGINAGTKTILVQTGIPGTLAPQATYTAVDLLDAVRYIEAHARLL